MQCSIHLTEDEVTSVVAKLEASGTKDDLALAAKIKLTLEREDSCVRRTIVIGNKVEVTYLCQYLASPAISPHVWSTIKEDAVPLTRREASDAWHQCVSRSDRPDANYDIVPLKD